MDTDEWQYIQLGREEITNEVFSKLKEKYTEHFKDKSRMAS